MAFPKHIWPTALAPSLTLLELRSSRWRLELTGGNRHSLHPQDFSFISNFVHRKWLFPLKLATYQKALCLRTRKNKEYGWRHHFEKCDAIVNAFWLNQLVAKNREMKAIYFPVHTTGWVQTARRKLETAREHSEGLMEWVELHLQINPVVWRFPRKLLASQGD